MKRSFVVFTIVLAIFLAACGGGSAAEPAQEVVATEEVQAEVVAPVFYLQIAKTVGEVEVRASANEEFAPAVEGQRLKEGAEIRTGADGVVALYRDELSMVIVDFNSEVQVKTLQGTKEVPITILYLSNGGTVIEHHAEKLPEGVFLVETPDGNNGSILGSTVRVGFNPTTGIMTATCLTGTCEFVRGEQKLTLEAGQAVDVTGLQPPPGAPSEMSVDQANQFLAMGYQLCGGCPITIGEIKDGGLGQTAPAPEDINEERPEENTNTEDSSNSDSSNENSSDNSGNENSNDSGNDSGGDSGGSGGDSGGGDSGGDSSGSGDG
jgi:hypothetical protein